MKITLQVNGREMTFSEEELTSILEKHFKKEESEDIQTVTEFDNVPTDGKWFKVNPSAIDQNLFKEKREDYRQQITRWYIWRAFRELEEHPERNKEFKTLIPEKTWDRMSIHKIEDTAGQLGDHMADWVEQALEWAQRIANGETWESLCNEADTANWYRLVVWRDGYAQRVGGSRKVDRFNTPASEVFSFYCYRDEIVDNIVPLVVAYE